MPLWEVGISHPTRLKPCNYLEAGSGNGYQEKTRASGMAFVVRLLVFLGHIRATLLDSCVILSFKPLVIRGRC
uniref:Uncharacterized protein n=1 Tax=Arundo donax TaxID=35708 RepID=A0A0A9DBX3_ARUDO